MLPWHWRSGPWAVILKPLHKISKALFLSLATESAGGLCHRVLLQLKLYPRKVDG